MEEKIIDFETAKILREKEFNILVKTYYEPKKFGKKVCEFYGKLDANSYVHWDNRLKKNVNAGYLSAPTQSLLQKWLREKYKIILIIGYQHEYDSTPYSYWIYKEGQSLPINQWVDDLKTYEEALEEGLKESLKLI